MGLSQPDVSKLLRGNFAGYTLGLGCSLPSRAGE